MAERPSAMQGIAGSIPGDRLLQKKVNNSWYFNNMCGLGRTAARERYYAIQIGARIWFLVNNHRN